MKPICFKKGKGVYGVLTHPFQLDIDYSEVKELPSDCYVMPNVIAALRLAYWMYGTLPGIDLINYLNPPYPKVIKRKGLSKEVAEIFRAFHLLTD